MHVEDADQLVGIVDHHDRGDLVPLHQRHGLGRKPVGVDAAQPLSFITLAKQLPEPLPAGVRMSWTLRVDGRRLAIAGRPMTEEEALASARARWPGASLEVLTDAD